MIVKTLQSGFTLLEILVATAIFSFIAVISYSSLSDALLVQKKTESLNERLSELQLAIQFMDKDFRQVINRPILDPSGGSITRPAINLGGNENIIEFTRTGWPNSLQQTRNELQRVAYIVEEEKLIRQYWQNLDRSSSDEGKKFSLLENINELNIQVLDSDDEWQTVWPPNDSNSALLPKAIEVVITSQEWGEIRRVYEVVQ